MGEPCDVKMSRTVREEGDGKGLQGTSPAPYFIRGGAEGKVPQKGNSPAAYPTQTWMAKRRRQSPMNQELLLVRAGESLGFQP